MKRLALLMTCALLAYGTGEADAQNKFHIGGAKPTRGRVSFELNGGAGRNPQFQVGGARRTGFNRFNRGQFIGSYPVAVGGGYGGSGFFGDGGFTNLYNQGFIPVPPYFALHPPVYYSAPVPRSYGYSPFPYPGNVPTPEVSFGPEEIVNPYVEPEDAPEEVPAPADAASTKTAAAPLMIRNLFVEQGQVASFDAN